MKKIITGVLFGLLVHVGVAAADEFEGFWSIYQVGPGYSPSERYKDNRRELIGTMELTRKKDGSYAGDLTIQQAHEICVAKRSGNKLNIRCKLAEPIANWNPDNFVLEKVADTRMTGSLLSSKSYLVDFDKQ